MSPELKSKLTPVLGRIPSGVFILVGGDGAGRRTGLLTSWVQQASFEPPQVTVMLTCRHGLGPLLVEELARNKAIRMSDDRRRERSCCR